MQYTVTCSLHGLVNTPRIREYRHSCWIEPLPEGAIEWILKRLTLPHPGRYIGPVVGWRFLGQSGSGRYHFSIYVLRQHPKAREKERLCRCFCVSVTK